MNVTLCDKPGCKNTVDNGQLSVPILSSFKGTLEPQELDICDEHCKEVQAWWDCLATITPKASLNA